MNHLLRKVIVLGRGIAFFIWTLRLLFVQVALALHYLDLLHQALVPTFLIALRVGLFDAVVRFFFHTVHACVEAIVNEYLVLLLRTVFADIWNIPTVPRISLQRIHCAPIE